MTDIKDLPPYEERYVAFLDILGFRSLVHRAALEPGLLDRIVAALTEVRAYAGLGQTMSKSAENDPTQFFFNLFQMSTFSDCIVMSTKANVVGLGLLSMLSAIMCTRLLHQGVFTRGAISRGKLIHTTEIVLGEGLIAAYELENSAAVYPRILLADSVANDFDAFLRQEGSLDLRRQDFDGLWHLHILHPKLLTMSHATSDSDHPPLKADFMHNGRREIINALRNTREPSVLAKLGWLARYFNEYAGQYGVQPVPLTVDGA